MTFDELWKKVWVYSKLPNTAKDQVPRSLSDKTKTLLLKSGKSASDIARIIQEAIDNINCGSTETLDILVRKKI